MKKYLLAFLMAVFLVTLLSGCSSWSQEKTSKTTLTEKGKAPEPQKNNYRELFSGEVSFSEFFPKEKIEELSGKKILNFRPALNKTQQFTEYAYEYQMEGTRYSPLLKREVPNNITISFLQGDVKSLREASKISKYEIRQDKSIPFPHQLIFDQKGNFRTLEIFLGEDLDLFVHTWFSSLTQDEALSFVKKLALYFKEVLEKKAQEKGIKASSQSSGGSVPLPQDEEVIRNFFAFIHSGEADKAASMMKTANDTEKQMWAVQFAAFNAVRVLKVEKANENSWTESKHFYKVILDVKMNPSSANAPIPYYGWQDGENTRWLTLEKVGNVFKISAIATGP